MLWRLRQFTAIARLTFLEVSRQPICLLVATACYLLIGLTPILVTHTLGESEKMARDSGLALQFVCGLILGAYAACSSLSREIRRGTVSSLLSKPVSREVFFIAKFVGIAAIMAFFSVGCTAATILSARTGVNAYIFDWWAGAPLLLAPPLAYLVAGLWNYFTQRPFVSSAFALLVSFLLAAFVISGFIDMNGHLIKFGALFSWKILPAAVLIALAVTVIAGIAVSLATRLDTVSTLSICTFIFLIGLMSDYLFGRQAASHKLAAALYLLIPNWQHFWMSDALSGPGLIPWSYVGHAALYAALYLIGVLSLGLLAFRYMEVKTRV